MHTIPEVIAAFHEAVNTADPDRAATLATDDVQVGGPRGSAQGVDLLRDWVATSGIRLTPTAAHPTADPDVLVVAQRATWPGDDATHEIATLFRTRAGRLTAVIRYDSLPAALAAAGKGTSG
ncbi:hypothetical protein GCM10022251_56080 [Phytohabitans flavus]|uniref:SnoaL-like domain-containing protein n=1 Tax=Phytohabitans flavus TaxID=1076124 RepID=A0A6F8XQJ6_9ACTN|nr:nuclear transport factor 2 family protein [Phytohabitans flavus]BCB76028.1 hypothetical protein Pflav_024380 [Phytohabitans flavus]